MLMKLHLLCQIRHKLLSEVINEPEAYIDLALALEAKYPPNALTFNIPGEGKEEEAANVSSMIDFLNKTNVSGELHSLDDVRNVVKMQNGACNGGN